jgi:sulfite reductase (NADPH) flavoprotein alpha-component
MLAIYLVIALTGLQWSYEWYRDGLYSFAGVKRVESGERRDARAGAPWPDLRRSWSAFLEETAVSGFSRATLRPPRGLGTPLEIRYLERQPAHSRAFNTLVVDPATGTVLRHDRYAETDAGGKLVASIFALHSGQFFGTPGMLAFALAALSMPLFAVTGWMLHLDRRRRKARSRARIRMTAVTQSR